MENGNDVNMFGEQLSQSIMLESSLGQVRRVHLTVPPGDRAAESVELSCIALRR